MNQDYFDKLSNMIKKAQEPFVAMTQLSAKTLQEFTYLKPEEFANLKKPEEYLEKQLEMVIANGHKALDYMQQMTQIAEKALLAFAAETKENTKSSAKK